MIKKYSGIICHSIRKSEKTFYIQVLASDSIYYKGIAVSKMPLDKGMYIDFTIVVKNDYHYFYIDEVSNFFGYYFWQDKILLTNLGLLLSFCSNNLPANAYIENLYENFIYQLRSIDSNNFDLEKFKKFILD